MLGALEGVVALPRKLGRGNVVPANRGGPQQFVRAVRAAGCATFLSTAASEVKLGPGVHVGAWAAYRRPSVVFRAAGAAH